MNSPIKISNLTDYIHRIDEITNPEKSYLYRGQEDEAWQVTSSAYRRLVRQTGTASGLLETQTDSEHSSLSEGQTEAELGALVDLFVGYLKQIVDEIQLRYPSTYRDLSQLECMAHLQHNGVATALIDFTFSPLVALWFACDGSKNTDGKIIMLEKDSKKIEEITTKNRLQQELDDFFSIDKEQSDEKQWYLWKPTLDSRTVDIQRMMMQQSVFLFGGLEVDAGMFAGEFVIPSGCKESLRTTLAKIGISEKTLFADLLAFFQRNTHAHPYDRLLPYRTMEEHHDEK